MNFLKTFFAAVLAFVAGTLLMWFLGIVVLLGIAGSMEGAVPPPEKAILKIDLQEMISDAPVSDPFAGINFQTMEMVPQLSLMQVLRTIETAATDDRIQGIYLRPNGMGAIDGTAVLEEMRAAIEEFKQSGKFVVAYNESYSQANYYLASVADSVYLQPEGAMEWTGMASNVMFYKGLLDKLDLKVEVFRPTSCRYKSAVEPYILNSMSAANREQMQTLVNSMWGTLTDAVSASRGIDVATLNSLADNLMVSLPEEALKHGLVDGIRYEDQMEEVFDNLGAERGVDGGFEYITLGEYATHVGADMRNILADEVAIVYANGQIVDGEGTDAVYGNTLASKLADVRADERVKAVVLRVNSPGGSALASDVVWREMELLRAEKPVVVSMGSYAASGGYYISCPADVIIADRMTLTGSIGVFGLILDSRAALKNKLGITIDGVTSNANSDFTSLSPRQKAMIMRGVDRVYSTFTEDVSKGRNLPLERVLEIAEGRVWSGEDALKIGLVDGLGGLKMAIAQAVDKAGLGEKYHIREVLDEPEGFAALFSSMNARVISSLLRPDRDILSEELSAIREAFTCDGIVMYSPYKVEL